MYVIAGVSGNTGSVVATTLLADKQPVRVIVRDAAKGEPWKAKGAEVFVGSMDDQAALTRALTGAKGVYLLLPPPGWSEPNIAVSREKLRTAILGAVRAAKPGHVVLLSSIGAHLTEGTGPIKSLHPLEVGLRASGVPTTFLRAASFMENWASLLPGAIAGGALYFGIREGLKYPQVATADIGKTTARLLVEGPQGTRVVELAGPAELSVQDVAATLAKITGKPIAGVSVPPEAMVQSLIGMHCSNDLATAYGEMVSAVNSGLLTWESSQLLRGTITLEQRLRELI